MNCEPYKKNGGKNQGYAAGKDWEKFLTMRIILIPFIIFWNSPLILCIQLVYSTLVFQLFLADADFYYRILCRILTILRSIYMSEKNSTGVIKSLNFVTNVHK